MAKLYGENPDHHSDRADATPEARVRGAASRLFQALDQVEVEIDVSLSPGALREAATRQIQVLRGAASRLLEVLDEVDADVADPNPLTEPAATTARDLYSVLEPIRKGEQSRWWRGEITRELIRVLDDELDRVAADVRAQAQHYRVRDDDGVEVCHSRCVVCWAERPYRLAALAADARRRVQERFPPEQDDRGVRGRGR